MFKTKTGGARTEVIFAAAALLAVVAMAAVFFTSEPASQQAVSPRDPSEVALAQLLSGEIVQFSDMQVRGRLDIYLDPTKRTDAQLRNAHRIWSERVGDPRYNDPALANDMFRIIDHAMRIRGVRPHAES